MNKSGDIFATAGGFDEISEEGLFYSSRTKEVYI